MATLRYQSPLPGFQARDLLKGAGLLKGSGRVDHGAFKLDEGRWTLLDLGRGLIEIGMPDDDVDAAMIVIPELIHKAQLEVVG